MQGDDQPPGIAARTAGREWLRDALLQSRTRTLALFAAFEEGLASSNLAVPLSAQLNPPAWELGHVAWFQDWWIARNRELAMATACEPGHARSESRLANADVLYDSGNVPHDTRWSLPLPGVEATKAYLHDSLAETLLLLGSVPETDEGLYFFRLVLLHEDMHGEAASYMAQALGISVPADVAFPSLPSSRGGTATIRMAAGSWTLGQVRSAPGFAFDNEQSANVVELDGFEIDATPVTWARYLPFAEATGRVPRYLRQREGAWERNVFGSWQPTDLAAPAVHLSLEDAQAWCRWAGRRLPTEAEWECVAHTHADFRWGDVWEWTASPFEPFPGFEPHPYRDYSAPWFGTRQVLRGASLATNPRVAHPKYRNFFTPERNDLYAGFRSCANKGV